MRRSARTVVLSLSVVALSPVLIGQVLPERFDVWPAALTAAALAAAIREHYRLGGALLGVGAAAKIYPVLLLPVLVIVVIRQRGVREAILVAGAALGAVAAVFLPFAIASFSGAWESLRIQFTGGLQIERAWRVRCSWCSATAPRSSLRSGFRRHPTSRPMAREAG